MSIRYIGISPFNVMSKCGEIMHAFKFSATRKKVEVGRAERPNVEPFGATAAKRSGTLGFESQTRVNCTLLIRAVRFGLML